MSQPPITVLRGGRVIDAARNVDRVTDVLMREGKILDVGDGLAPAGAQIIDASGQFVTPGWIDNHMHAYGTLGFADPDSIGICHGVTSYVDAGGPGIASLDEFVAMLDGQLITDLYAGPYIRPMGIIGAQFIEGDIRSLTGVPIPEWLDFMEKHPGVVRYLKIAALGGYGTGPIKLGKGLAEIIGVPLYSHIGEYQMQPEDPSAYEVFRVSEAGDMIAHPFHTNGAKIIDDQGMLLPVVIDAKARGVLFDIAFGSYNYSWQVADRAFAQGLYPDIISSDLQQFSALGPAYSLAHVMSILLHQGMSVAAVMQAVTDAPARALKLTDRAGSLTPGLPADVTVSRIESGSYELADTQGVMRTASQRFMPTMVFKRGVQHAIDMTRCQDDKNWILQIAEDHIPAAARSLSKKQIAFLGAMRSALESIDWAYDLKHLDLAKAHALRALFDQVRAAQDMPLREGLVAMYSAFLDNPFTMQIGLFILHLERKFALARLAEITQKERVAA